ncbi:MAG: hypothetical protein P8179_21010, partial [Candidatus Thiodiazotropha sp.]
GAPLPWSGENLMKSDAATLLAPPMVLIGEMIGLWYREYSTIHCISVVNANPWETSEVEVA